MIVRVNLFTLSQQFKYPILLCALLLVALAPSPSFGHHSAMGNNTIIVGYNRSLSMPLAQIKNYGSSHIASKGLLVEIAQYIAKSLNKELKQLVINRDDMSSALMNGSVDIICYSTPQWLKIPSSSVLWSKPIIKTKDILISKKGLNPIQRLQDLTGLTVGTVKHYKYPFIDEEIKSGNINIFAVIHEQANFMQLFRSNNVDAIIFKELTFDYLYSKYSNKDQFPIQKHPLIMEFIEPQCALSKHSEININDINQIIDSIISNKIVESYLASIMDN